MSTATITHADIGATDLTERLAAANERAALLEQQLATVTAERDAAEHRASDLEDRNRELASDLDDALDQLEGHALHDHQERLIRPAHYANAFAGLGGNAFAAAERDGADR
ncbi:hypothetical protein [Nocardia brasiliensis]|uniref:hypothetical protein n=1 Tax=Nocardia brasiliensis TaxID=37326 RepID=UPI0024553DBE|nr:hypothetical protein [Nocardia brasiliensis]